MREAGKSRLSKPLTKINHRDHIVMSFLIRDLTYVIGRFAKGKLLDIGCGNKPYEELFTGKIDSYTGCDVVQSSLQRVDVICEATTLDFDTEQFDTVFSTQVIEHVQDPFAMLKEAHRVLNEGGNLILSAPFCWELHEEPHDYFRYSKYGLQSMLKNTGFEILYIKENGGKWAAIFQMNLNIIYSTFSKKGVFVKLIKGLFINLHFTALINRIALWLDRKFHSDLLTLNYVVVATKVSKTHNSFA
jgi:2-polyprenyl-3-methyl-5-hydroxy-6-metoxy-1,4-benzoquinol methylase